MELTGVVIRIEITLITGWANVWIQLDSGSSTQAVLPFPVAVANNFRLGEVIHINLTRELAEERRGE